MTGHEHERLSSTTDIARRYGVSVATISLRIAARGMKPVATRGAAKLYTERQVRSLRPRQRGRPRGS